MSEPVTFLASLPPIQSALKVGGDGSARIQLDIPETEREAVKALMDMHGKVLSVAVVIAERETLTNIDDGTVTQKAKRSAARLDRRRA